MILYFSKYKLSDTLICCDSTCDCKNVLFNHSLEINVFFRNVKRELKKEHDSNDEVWFTMVIAMVNMSSIEKFLNKKKTLI